MCWNDSVDPCVFARLVSIGHLGKAENAALSADVSSSDQANQTFTWLNFDTIRNENIIFFISKIQILTWVEKNLDIPAERSYLEFVDKQAFEIGRSKTTIEELRKKWFVTYTEV